MTSLKERLLEVASVFLPIESEAQREQHRSVEEQQQRIERRRRQRMQAREGVGLETDKPTSRDYEDWMNLEGPEGDGHDN